MSGDTYVKIFPEMFESSLWSEGDNVLRVWLVMLGKCDKYGFVKIPIPGLARIANVSIEQAESALHILESPDKYSKSKEEEGRRCHRCCWRR